MIGSGREGPIAFLRWGVALVAALLMGITVFDVVGRYLFGTPLPGADELTRFAMAILVFGALPFAKRAGGHVRVDFLTNLTKGRVSIWFDGMAFTVTGIVLCFIGWRLVLVGQNLAGYDDRTAILALPLAPLAFLMAAFAVLGGLTELVQLLRLGGDRNQ